MATNTGVSFCVNLHGFCCEGGLVSASPAPCTGGWRHSGRAWRPRQIGLTFALVFLFPRAILSAEPAIEIFVDSSSMGLSGVSPKNVKDMAKVNKLGDPDDWPVYKTTGHPDYRLPASFIRREKDHPEWDLKKLSEYRIAFRTFANGKREQRIIFLYRRQANVLFVLYKDMPPKAKDANSPF
jgi:hypothetical protein